MGQRTEGFVDGEGVRLHYAEQGSGPLVLFCHGFPESWYSWRHQLSAVAEAGFRAVALTMRGFGHSGRPTDPREYSIDRLIGDVTAAVHGLGADTAVVVGHDWGAPVAWYSALEHPDVVRAVAGFSVPFTPPTGPLPEGITLTGVLRSVAGPDRDYYQLYFQQPGRAEADLGRDVRRSVVGFLYTLSGDAVVAGDRAAEWDGHFPLGESWNDQMVVPNRLPSWLTESDVDFYVRELSSSGFVGGLNWYRNMDSMPELLSAGVGATINQPSFYMGGSVDLVSGNTPAALDRMRSLLADLRHCELLDGVGHWVQQERPHDVNEALIGFLTGL